MKLNKLLLPIVAGIGFLIFLSLFVVKETNQAIVLQFGDPKKVIVEPGLQIKIPFIQNVVFIIIFHLTAGGKPLTKFPPG